jgi:CRP-like cAMP-binding protein
MASGDDRASRSRSELRRELALGRRQLNARLQSLQPCTFSSGEILAMSAGPRDPIYHIRAGWACQYYNLANGRRAIVHIYLSGDVVGLDAVLRTPRLREVLTLTSVTVGVIREEDVLIDLMACRPVALYIAWLLGQRQRRADQVLAAVSCLDARGRLATMLLGFYTRLRRRRLITGSTYNLPLTRIQIAGYLGLTVPSVNCALRSLRGERIAQIEKHCVTILDLERLACLAQHGGRRTQLRSSTSAPQTKSPPKQ